MAKKKFPTCSLFSLPWLPSLTCHFVKDKTKKDENFLFLSKYFSVRSENGKQTDFSYLRPHSKCAVFHRHSSIHLTYFSGHLLCIHFQYWSRKTGKVVIWFLRVFSLPITNGNYKKNYKYNTEVLRRIWTKKRVCAAAIACTVQEARAAARLARLPAYPFLSRQARGLTQKGKEKAITWKRSLGESVSGCFQARYNAWLSWLPSRLLPGSMSLLCY